MFEKKGGAFVMCGTIEEVVFLSKWLLMICTVMDCFSRDFQNTSNTILFFLCVSFISTLGGNDE